MAAAIIAVSRLAITSNGAVRDAVRTEARVGPPMVSPERLLNCAVNISVGLSGIEGGASSGRCGTNRILGTGPRLRDELRRPKRHEQPLRPGLPARRHAPETLTNTRLYPEPDTSPRVVSSRPCGVKTPPARKPV